MVKELTYKRRTIIFYCKDCGTAFKCSEKDILNIEDTWDGAIAAVKGACPHCGLSYHEMGDETAQRYFYGECVFDIKPKGGEQNG